MGKRMWRQTTLGVVLMLLPVALWAQVSPAVRYNNAVKLYQDGKLDDAKAEFEKVLAADAKDTTTMVWLGVIALRQNNPAAAIDMLTKATDLKKDDALAWNNLGIAQLATADGLDKAISAFQKAVGLDKSYADAYYNLGIAFSRKKDLDSAIGAYKKAVDLSPNNPDYLNNLGNAQREAKQITEACVCYRKARTLRPDDPTFMVNLGLGLWDQGDLKGALKEFEAAAAKQPENFTAQLYKGIGYLKLARIPDAVAALTKAVELRPDDFSAQFNLALASGQLGTKEGFERAVAANEAALKLKADDVNTINNLGWAYFKLNNFDKAEELFKRAIAADPKFPLAPTNLAVLYMKKDPPDLAKAEEQWDTVTKLEPENVNALVQLGDVRYNLGKFDGSRTALEAAVAKKTQDPEAFNKLGLIADADKRYADAVKRFQEAIALKPTYAVAYNNLGVVLEKQGKMEDAQKMYKKALELDPNYPPAKYNLERFAKPGEGGAAPKPAG